MTPHPVSTPEGSSNVERTTPRPPSRPDPTRYEERKNPSRPDRELDRLRAIEASAETFLDWCRNEHLYRDTVETAALRAALERTDS